MIARPPPLHRRPAALLACSSPRLPFAQAATERRFVFIIQRGAADGLNTVVPYGDPAYAKWRGALAVDVDGAAKLDGTFTLHPALAEAGELYGAGEALFVHAVASPYRDRSHFDGQNVLETGGSAAYQVKDGWMNRLRRPAAAAVEARRSRSPPTVPMALRGPAEVTSYAPSALAAARRRSAAAGRAALCGRPAAARALDDGAATRAAWPARWAAAKGGRTRPRSAASPPASSRGPTARASR